MWLRLSVFFISASALSYEILLTRLFSITGWHHFSYMIISVALLGFGASGTFLTLARGWVLPRWSSIYLANALFFGLTLLGSFSLAQRIPFNPLEILWDLRQFLYLFGIYALLILPFFFAANCIGLVLTRFPDQIFKIYRYDLMGAGVGALAVVGALFVFFPFNCLKLFSGLGIFAAVLAVLDPHISVKRVWVLVFFFAALLIPWLWPSSWSDLKISPYKGLTLALQVPDTEVMARRSSPLGLLTVVRSPTIPFRYAPGLSLNSQKEPQEQLGLFTDGDSLSPITRFDGRAESISYLDFLSSALPYHLLNQPSVLILGGGGGGDVLLARYHGVPKIEVVELNPQVLKLMEKDFSEFSGKLYQAGEVKTHLAEARSFVARTPSQPQFDLIQLSLIDSFGAASAGLYALSENYLYTVEALQDYLQHLRPNGILTITRWLKLPPRDSLKLVATALTALRSIGVKEPGKDLAMIRSWKTTTLLVKKGEFTAGDIERLKNFCHQRSFDLVYYPGMPKEEANRYNQLAAPYFYEGVHSLLGPQAESFQGQYKFHIEPATDDRPFFFHFFKWRTLPEILSLRGRGGLPLLEWGYPILVATLVQALLASLVLIFLPLHWLPKGRVKDIARFRVGGYFLILGLAFLFIEIAFIQRFILFLGHPLYAISVVLCGFLIFAGLGSGYSARLARRPLRAIVLAAGMIALITLLYRFFLPMIFQHFLSQSDGIRIALSLLLIAPLAFFMGMPFPLGLTLLSLKQPQMIPWAWGINGCASVLSAILATLLAIHFGFGLVLTLAALLYLVAPLAWLGRKLG